MGPEESDCQGSCLILYACNQSVVVALDVEHHSAALENARFWIRRLHLSWGAPLSAPHNGKPSIVLRPCAWHEFPKMEDAQSMQRNSAVHPPVGVGEARLRQRPGRSVLCAGVHVVRLVGRARLQRYNTSSRDRELHAGHFRMPDETAWRVVRGSIWRFLKALTAGRSASRPNPEK